MKMKNRIKEIMTCVFQLESVADDISQSNCARWDSMNHLNLVIELEEEFDTSFEPEEIAMMKDLESVEKMIIAKKAN
jgi:acyl carrier protein